MRGGVVDVWGGVAVPARAVGGEEADNACELNESQTLSAMNAPD